MTGFATLEGGDGQGLGWSWELRSVNGRGLELRLRLPEGLGALEAPLRRLLSERITRGSVSLSLRLVRDARPGPGAISDARLAAILDQIARIHVMAEARGLPLGPATAAEILTLGTMGETGADAGLPEAERILSEAQRLVQSFDAMRHAEGAALAAILRGQLDRIEALVESAALAAAARSEPQAARLREAASALMQEGPLDEQRLFQELAVLALKTDVTEEIDRLRAHVGAARALLGQGGAVGRKLDFLMQEFNREANTLCSKSQDGALTAVGLDLKLAIDQTREQVQNVE